MRFAIFVGLTMIAQSIDVKAPIVNEAWVVVCFAMLIMDVAELVSRFIKKK